MKHREHKTVKGFDDTAIFALCTMGSGSEDNQTRPDSWCVAQQKLPELATVSASAFVLDRSWCHTIQNHSFNS